MALDSYKKATNLFEIDNAVRLDVPLTADHPFFTDFSDVRGEFEEKALYRHLNVDSRNLKFRDEANRQNKTLLFLAGMRGSGKTSELAKIGQKLNHPDGFFVVTCNIDEGLDLNDMEYMDILIFQLECLFEELEKRKVKVGDKIIGSLQKWFSERVKEVNTAIKKEGGFEVKMGAKTPSLLSFINIAFNLKSSLVGSKESANKIRTVFRQNFSDFAKKINEFIEYTNIELRKKGVAKEILFIIDGLEKTGSLDIRRKIIIEDIQRIIQIKANTIITLPIELMSDSSRLAKDYKSDVISFPFVKIREKDGTIVEKAIERFVEFTYRRIDKKLFDNPETIRRAILVGGGSPREYLRLLEYASIYADEEKGIIDGEAVEKAIKKLAAQSARYVTKEDLETLKILKEANQSNQELPFGTDWQKLLENLIVLEYNDGTYKRVNPIIEESELYKYYVG